MSLDLPLCDRCDGYLIEGTLRRTGISLNSRCRCDDTDWDRKLEADARERAANVFGDLALTETQSDPFLKRRTA